MKVVVLMIVLVAAAAVGGEIFRRAIRRHRWTRRLEKAEVGVAAAVADGRMLAVTGEALLQHLEGLRRVCSGAGED